MSEEEGGWLDSIGDTLSDAGAWVEEQVDTDSDGSLLDNILETAAEYVPYADKLLPEGAAEDAGDFLTDTMGTRKAGVFSEEGTWSAESSDADYQGDGVFDGAGQWVNETFGIGENRPTDLMEDAYDTASEFIGGSETPAAE
ncbi:MAG: hypothetical protein ACRD0U_14420 [Acidimicrobiales bacterium]